MTYLSTLRRHAVAALSIAAILTVIPATVSHAGIPQGRHEAPAKICNYDWHKGTWQIKQLIRCAADHWNVPGGESTALAIADRESQFHPNAYNSSGCAGIDQHMLRYWPGRATAYGFSGWSAFNARANIIVTMRMVEQDGWGPWS
ncbi:MAG: transglycosylase SLT domain-containing protein [Actinomycetota bacterium]